MCRGTSLCVCVCVCVSICVCACVFVPALQLMHASMSHGIHRTMCLAFQRQGCSNTDSNKGIKALRLSLCSLQTE